MKLLQNLLILLFAFSSFHACTAKTAPQESVQKTDEIKPFLWEATKGKQKMYLFGTVHLGVALSELPVRVLKSVQASDQLIVEVDLASIKQEEVMPLVVWPPQTSLSKEMSPSSFKRLQQLLQGVPAAQLERLRPSAILPMILQRVVRLQTEPMDQSLIELAHRQNKKIIELESGEKQLKILNEVYTAKTLQEFLETGEPAELQKTLEQEFARLITAYKEGNGTKLMAQMLGEDAPMMQISEKERVILLDRRNMEWMKSLSQLPKNKVSFVAVGAGHLFGPRGLLSLLEKKGYKLSRI